MNQTATVSHQVKCQSTKSIKVSFPPSGWAGMKESSAEVLLSFWSHSGQVLVRFCWRAVEPELRVAVSVLKLRLRNTLRGAAAGSTDLQADSSHSCHVPVPVRFGSGSAPARIGQRKSVRRAELGAGSDGTEGSEGSGSGPVGLCVCVCVCCRSVLRWNLRKMRCQFAAVEAGPPGTGSVPVPDHF